MEKMIITTVTLNVIGMLYCVWLGYYQPNWELAAVFAVYLVSAYLVAKKMVGVISIVVGIVNVLMLIAGLILIPVIWSQWPNENEGIVRFFMLFIPFLIIGPTSANTVSIILVRLCNSERLTAEKKNG